MTIENALRNAEVVNTENCKPWSFPGNRCMAGGLDIAYPNSDMPDNLYDIWEEAYDVGTPESGEQALAYTFKRIFGIKGEWTMQRRDGNVETLDVGYAWATDEFTEFKDMVEDALGQGCAVLGAIADRHVEALLKTENGYVWGCDVLLDNVEEQTRPIEAVWDDFWYEHPDYGKIIYIFPPELKG